MYIYIYIRPFHYNRIYERTNWEGHSAPFHSILISPFLRPTRSIYVVPVILQLKGERCKKQRFSAEGRSLEIQRGLCSGTYRLPRNNKMEHAVL